MPITRCPECGTQVRVEDRDVGYDVECPSCRAVFTARSGDTPPARREEPPRRDDDDRPSRRRAPPRRDEFDDDEDDRPSRRAPPRRDEFDDDDRPSRRRRRYEDDLTDDDEDDRLSRRRRRRYEDDLTDEELVEGARDAVRLPAILSIVACVLAALYHVFDLLVVLANPQILQNNPLLGNQWGNQGGFQWTPELYAAARLFSITWQVVVLVGSVMMARLKGRQFSLAAMVLQVIPCGAGICCILTLPVGIWGLVVLNRPDVREGFELAARGVGARDRDDDDEGFDR